ncbi:MAG: zf-HC2 domain-containing protein [Oscillospiraceae bacterium]|nr:zf-HC2 domain-containing protein [Oscillospiraceae bacterium]
MEMNCEVIRDLLPLYADGACSPASAALVREHIGGCQDCAALLERLENQGCEAALQREACQVVERHRRKERRRTAAVLGCVLIVPVLVCLIVNLAADHRLDWFFIVLTALLVFASVTVVPLVCPRRQGLWTLTAFVGSLLLLLLTCCLYTGGRWFLVTAVCVIFGLSVPFLPCVAGSLPLGRFFGRNRGLLVLLWDTLCLAVMLAVIGLYNNASGDYYRTAFGIAVLCAAVVWAVFLLLRYLPANRLVRAGLAVALIGTFLAFADPLINNCFLRVSCPWFYFNLTQWSGQYIDGNIAAILLFASLAVGAVLTAAGILRARREK